MADPWAVVSVTPAASDPWRVVSDALPPAAESNLNPKAVADARAAQDSRYKGGQGVSYDISLTKGRVAVPWSRSVDQAKLDDMRGTDVIQGYMLNGLDEVVGAGAALKNGAQNVLAGVGLGKSPGYGMGDAYEARRAVMNQDLAGYRKDHHVESTVNNIAGAVANPLNFIGGAYVQGARGGSAVARAAQVGGAMGAAAGAGAGEGAAGRLKGAAVSGTVGATVGAGAQVASNALGAAAASAAARAPSPQRVLSRAGVQLTPGQAMGGAAKTAEDIAQRAPILGPAISGARQRSVESLSTAVANEALAPIGETLPMVIKPGNAAVAYVGRRIGQEYDRAAALVSPMQADQQFTQTLAGIQQTASELPTDIAKQFKTIVNNRVLSQLKGPVDGAAIRRMQSQLSNLSARYGGSSDGGQRLLAEHLDDVSEALGDMMGRSSPEASAIVQKANQAWRGFAVMRNAAAKDVKAGIPTPGQLSTAVRTADRSVAKGATAMGDATMQGLSSAASRVLPDQFGNPGTANALLAIGGAGGMLTHPAQTLAIGGGLTAAAAGYTRPALTAFNALYRATDGLSAAGSLSRLAGLVAQYPELAPELEARRGASRNALADIPSR